MDYLKIVNATIDYIEETLFDPIALYELASNFYLSSPYFYRIFRAVTHHTVSSYINRRRLTEAAKAISGSNRRIIDIALDYGFNSHEVFTRNFQKEFGITPIRYRSETPLLPFFHKMKVVERTFKNQNKDIVVNYKLQTLKEIPLAGAFSGFLSACGNPSQVSAQFIEDFTLHHFRLQTEQRFFHVVQSNLHLSAIKNYCGVILSEAETRKCKPLIIPAAHYAVFPYKNRMKDIFHTVMSDVYKCMNVTGLKYRPVGIDLFVIYTVQEASMQLYVPVF